VCHWLTRSSLFLSHGSFPLCDSHSPSHFVFPSLVLLFFLFLGQIVCFSISHTSPLLVAVLLFPHQLARCPVNHYGVNQPICRYSGFTGLLSIPSLCRVSSQSVFVYLSVALSRRFSPHLVSLFGIALSHLVAIFCDTPILPVVLPLASVRPPIVFISLCALC